MIPLFPDLKQVLDEAWELALEGAVYAVDEKYRRAANSKTGWRNCNLPTTFKKIVERAGLKPWPKLFHALRSSRETELAQELPIHVVTTWLGNTPTIALRHYLLTTDGDFARAAAGGNESAEAAKTDSKEVTQKAVQKGTAMARNRQQAPIQKSPNTKENGRLRCVATGHDVSVNQ